MKKIKNKIDGWEVFFNGTVYFVKDSDISSQYIGTGKTISFKQGQDFYNQ